MMTMQPGRVGKWTRPVGVRVSKDGKPMTAFGCWIADGYERLGQHGSQFAETAGISPQALNKLLFVDERPRVETMVAIATALDCSIVDVIKAAGYELPPKDR
jgi:transcriptional regulator with XRE-family HTH domain